MIKVGTSVVAEVTLYRVDIQGRGGDSVHDEYFETKEDAIMASAVDGQNHLPARENVLKLSEGTLIKMPVCVHVSAPPTPAEMEDLKSRFTPAQKILFGMK